MDNETKQALEAMEERILERIEQVETNLLSAFRDWQTPIQMRLRTLPQIDERLGLLEERITKLEQKNLEH